MSSLEKENEKHWQSSSWMLSSSRVDVVMIFITMVSNDLFVNNICFFTTSFEYYFFIYFLFLLWVWDKLNFSAYFHFQIIFATIHGSHCTFWYYSWVPLYYSAYFFNIFSILLTKSFQFQLNKLFQMDT